MISNEEVIKYKNGLIAMIYGNKSLVFDKDYLLGKHGTGSESFGSKLIEVDSEEKLVEIFRKFLSKETLERCDTIMQLPNISTGYKTGNDALVEIISIKDKSKTIPLGTPLKEDKLYEARVKDASGREINALISYKITKPASKDGNYPAIKRIVAYTPEEPQSTDIINIVLGKVNIDSEQSMWLEPKSLKEALRNCDPQITEFYAVFTLFPGKYAPAANEPNSSKIDNIVGIMGNEFWSRHALMKHQNKQEIL